MAERGPLPKLYTRRRNWRPGNLQTVEIGRPACPKQLQGEARAEWNRVVPEIEAMGLLTAVDRGLLIRYCTAWADWVDLDEKVRQTGKLVKGAHGNAVRNPLWMMRRDTEMTLAEMGRQLMLGPTARLRAGITHERPEERTDAKAAEIREIEEYRRLVQGWTNRS